MFLTSVQLQSIRKMGKQPSKGLNDGQEHSAKRSSKECLMVQCKHAPGLQEAGGAATWFEPAAARITECRNQQGRPISLPGPTKTLPRPD
jgi:hypothetical protein